MKPCCVADLSSCFKAYIPVAGREMTIIVYFFVYRRGRLQMTSQYWSTISMVQIPTASEVL